MTKKQRYEIILSYFRQEMPEADTELEFGSIFQLLVAVVLSAQCTDKRINQVTPELFRQYPSGTLGEAGTHARGAPQRRGACRHESAAGLAWRRSQDGQCHSVGSLWQVNNGCRYARLPRESSLRTGFCEGRQPTEGGTGTGKKYTRGRYSTGTSLVIASRTLRLYGTPSSL